MFGFWKRRSKPLCDTPADEGIRMTEADEGIRMTEAEWFRCSDPRFMLQALRSKGSSRQRRLYACACCRLFWHLFTDERSRRAVEAAELFADGLLDEQGLQHARQQAEAAAEAARVIFGEANRRRQEQRDKQLSLGRPPHDYGEARRLQEWRGKRSSGHPGQGYGGPPAWKRSPLREASLEEFGRAWSAMQAACAAAATAAVVGYDPSEDLTRICSSDNPLLSVVSFLSEGQLGCAVLGMEEPLRDIFGNPFQPVALDATWLAQQGATPVQMAGAIYEERAFDRLPLLAEALAEAGCTAEPLIAHCRVRPEDHYRGCWALDALLGRA
jgi:hypothetical protein